MGIVLKEGKNKVYLKWDRILSFLMAFFAGALSVVVYASFLFRLGFPDGYVTALDRAERILAYVFIGGSFPVGLWFCFLGWIAPHQRIRKKLGVSACVYAAFTILLFVIDFYLGRHLDNGFGG